MSKQNSLSQNFLTSGQVIRRIVGLAGLDQDDHVVEIGPGKGHITRELLARCDRVTAVEIDPALCAKLRVKFAGSPNLRLVRGDFLAWPLPRGPYIFRRADLEGQHGDQLRRVVRARTKRKDMKPLENGGLFD